MRYFGLNLSSTYPSPLSCFVLTFANINRRVKAHLEPLAIAANITQVQTTRFDHVLLTWANLYRIYPSADIEDHVRVVLHASLEKRWKKADQDVYILAVFFNPYVHGRCFSRTALSSNDLINIARRTFHRLFREHPSVDFVKGLLDYSKGQAEFSDEKMMLDFYKTLAERESQVRTI